MAYGLVYRNNLNERVEIFCRNVSAKNPDEALQFEIQKERGKRTYFTSFSLPASEIPKFIEAIQQED